MDFIGLSDRQRLPRHVMACMLAQQPQPAAQDGWQEELTAARLTHDTRFGHLSRALNLLATLCGLAETAPVLAQVVAAPGFQEQMADLLALVLASVAGPEAHACAAAASEPARAQEALERAALVPNALRAAVCALQPAACAGPALGPAHWRAVAAGLTSGPRSALLLDALFDATATVYAMVRAALRADSGAADTYELAFHAAAAMEVLSELCATPLFYYRLALHDPSMAAPMRLVAATLALHDPPLAPPPWAIASQPSSDERHGSDERNGRDERDSSSDGSGKLSLSSSFAPDASGYSTSAAQGAAELLVARGLALLNELCGYDEVPFLDRFAAGTRAHQLALSVVDRALAYAALAMRRPPMRECRVRSPGEGQLAVNALQTLEVLADDSNFRALAMEVVAEPVAAVLALPHGRFVATWCAGEEATALHAADFSLDGRCLLLGPATPSFQRRLDALNALADPGGQNFAGLPAGARSRARHVAVEAGQRALALFQALGNLHCFSPTSSAPRLRHRFVRLLAQQLRLIKPLGADASEKPPAFDVALGNLRRLGVYAADVVETLGGGQAAGELVQPEDAALLAALARTLAALRDGDVPDEAIDAATSQHRGRRTRFRPIVTCERDCFEDLLAKGRHNTLSNPQGQLFGRAGQQCCLEDGERILLRAVAQRPESIDTRLLLVHNRLRLRGREHECRRVPFAPQVLV
ncbi:hypothetical protein WJX81_006292 [Elliptochloris bilobata]|uniref:Nodulin homeobox N-terminal domain-containing protein n=1 Tax=Elliptochloris bilobata TaxID=381761 RepID=A0AAW1SD87_9CHLO